MPNNQVMNSSGIISNPLSTKSLVNDRTNLVILRLKAIYPTLWLRNVTNNIEIELIKNEWNQILKYMKDSEIEKALISCKLFYKYPPSISEFIYIALDIKPYEKLDKLHPLYIAADERKGWAWDASPEEAHARRRINYEIIVEETIRERFKK